MKSIALLGVIVLFSVSSQAQTLPEARIKEYYDYRPLSEVLDHISEKYGLKFQYDQDDLKSLFFTRYFNNTPSETAVRLLFQPYPKLSYYISENGVVHVTRDLSEVAQKTSESTRSNRKFTGKAENFDLTISGIIRDRKTGESLPFASVSVRGSNNGASTNIDGYFTLFHVPSDTSTLQVSYIGYSNATFYLSPELAKKNVIVELSPIARQLEEVVVAGQREALLATNEEVSVMRMTPKQIANLPNIGEKDIMRSFQLMPGVAGSNEASSGLFVRGGTPDQNLVLYDGFTVYHVDHLFGFFSAFNSNAIKDVKLYKGGFESKYGGRLSSVTELTGKEGNQKQFNLGGDVSLLSFNAFAETPIGNKVTVLAAFRRSWKGPIYNTIFDRFSDENETEGRAPGGAGRFANAETTVSSYFYDLNGKVTYKPTDRDILSVSFYNGTDKLDNSRLFSAPSFGARSFNFQSDIIDLTNWGNTGGSLKWSRRWSPNFYGNTLVSFSNFFNTRDRSVEGSRTDANGEEFSFKRGTVEDNNLQDLSFKSDYEWKIGQHNQLEFGVQATQNDVDYTFVQNDTISVLDRHDIASTYSGYLQNNMSFWNGRLRIKPGLRYSYYDGTEKTYFEPRINGSVQVADRIKVKGAWGKYYQFANKVIREDVLSGNREFWIMADDAQVPVSSAVHHIAGISYETKDYLFDVEAYYKTLEGLTEYSLRFQPRFGAVDYDENFFHGDGTARGIEFLAQRKFGQFTGWASYTLSEVEYEFPGLSETPFPAAHDVTHEFKLVSMYKWKRWNFSATWIYATGKPYTAPDGGYQLTLLDGTVEDYITVGAKNGLRLPDYHRLDIAGKFNFFMGESKSPGSIGLSLFNLYDRSNTWYKEYEVQDGQVFETDVNFLGFTPNITLSLSIR